MFASSCHDSTMLSIHYDTTIQDTELARYTKTGRVTCRRSNRNRQSMTTETQPMPSPRRPMTIIVAATLQNGIGVAGGLPWRLPGEMKYFARGTSPPPPFPSCARLVPSL